MRSTHTVSSPRSVSRLVLVVALTALAPTLALAQAPSPSASASSGDELKKRGDDAMESLRYADALGAYAEAYALTKDPALLYNQGRAQQALSNFPEALLDFERFAREASVELKARVPKLDELLADVRKHVARLAIRCDTRGARVLVRERVVGTTPLATPLDVDSGFAAIEVDAEGYEPYKRDVDLAGGTQTILDVVLVPRKLTALLRVESTAASALVSIDGAPVGNAPIEQVVTPGTHRVAVHRDWVRGHRVERGDRRGRAQGSDARSAEERAGLCKVVVLDRGRGRRRGRGRDCDRAHDRQGGRQRGLFLTGAGFGPAPLLMRRALLFALQVAVGGALGGCRSPTQISIAVSTNVPCASWQGAAVAVGELGPALESAPAATTSTYCDATGHVGTVVAVPSGRDNANVAFRVVGAVSQTLDSCTADAGAGCIVARRALNFIPHEALVVSVPLLSSCEGVVCDPSSTCVAGTCRPATIVDPGACAEAPCGEGALPLPDGGATEAGGGAVDGGLDGGAGVDATLGDAETPDGASGEGGGDLDAAPSGCGGQCALALGASFTCALRSGVVSCWGQNYLGELGIGTQTSLERSALA